MSRNPAAARRACLIANAIGLKAGQRLMPGGGDAIAKAMHSNRTKLRTDGKCGAMIFAGMATGLVCNLLAACAVGPDFQEPPAPDVKGFTPQPLAHETASAGKSGGAHVGEKCAKPVDHQAFQIAGRYPPAARTVPSRPGDEGG